MTRRVLTAVFMLVCCFCTHSLARSHTNKSVLICDQPYKQGDIAYEYAKFVYAAFLDSQARAVADTSALEYITSEVDGGEKTGCVSRRLSSVTFIRMDDDCVHFLEDWCLKVYAVSYTDIFGKKQTGYAIKKDMYDILSNTVYSDRSFRIEILNTDLFDELGQTIRDLVFSLFQRTHHCPTITLEATTFTIDDGTC